MMKNITSQEFLQSVVNVHDKDHYTIDTNQFMNGTAVTCPFDSSMQIGKNNNGEVCIVKKSFFKPFKKI